VTQPIYPPQEWPVPDTQAEPETPDERIGVDLYPVIGQGALSIDDGGGYYNYNQDLDEDAARGTWQFPDFSSDDNVVSLIGILRDIMTRLPIEALKIFETWIEGGLEIFENVWDAVTKIIDALTFKNIGLRVDQFLELLVGWVEATPGDLDNWLLSLVGVDSVYAGSLSKKPVELLLNPFFTTDVSLKNGSSEGWVLDPDDKHSETGNAAVLFTTAVQDYVLYSSQVKIEDEQVMHLKAHVKWSGITQAISPSGNAITLSISPEAGGAPLDPIVLDSQVSSVASSVDEVSDWIELEGEWSVPIDFPADTARLLVTVEGVNTGAEIKVSDISFKKEMPSQWMPMEWLDGLFDAFSGVDEYLQNIVAAILGGFMDDDQSQWTLLDIWDDFTGWFLDTEEAYRNAGESKASVTDILNNTIAAFFGLKVNEGGTEEEARWAMDSVHDQIRGISTRVNELWSGGGPGEFYSVLFNQYQDGTFAEQDVPFDVFYTGEGDGQVQIYNQLCDWAEGTPGAGNRQCVCVYNNPDGDSVTDTNFQLLTMTVNGLPEISGLSSPASGSNTAVARCHAGGTSYVYAKAYRVDLFGTGLRVELGYVDNGVTTIWEAVNKNISQWGSTLSLQAGDASSPHRFRVWINDKELIDYTDAAQQAAMDAAHRGWGFGLSTGNNGYASPSEVAYAAIADI